MPVHSTIHATLAKEVQTNVVLATITLICVTTRSITLPTLTSNQAQESTSLSSQPMTQKATVVETKKLSVFKLYITLFNITY